MANLSVIEHNRNDDPKIFALQQLTYPDNPIYSDYELTKKYWQWRYFSSSQIKSHIYVIKSDDGDVICGMRPTSIVPIKVNDKIINSLWLTAVITHPDHRGKGIFTRLVRHSIQKAKDQGVKFAYTFPNEISYAIYKKRNEWKYLAPTPIFVKITNLGSLVEKKLGLPFMKKVLNFQNLKSFTRTNCQNKINTNGKFYLKDTKFLGKEYDILWQRSSESFPIAIQRDSKYLEWRYLKNPVFKYEIIEARDKYGELSGYVILSSQTRKGIKLGLIVDILTMPEKKEVIQILIRESVERLVAKNVDMICALMRKNHPYGICMKQCGFFALPTKIRCINFIYSILNDYPYLENQLNNFNKWFLTWGDTDNA